MDFKLSKEQAMLQKLFQEFAENEVKPIAADVDEEERFPEETVKKMAKLGMMGIYLPKEYGGAGADILSLPGAGLLLAAIARYPLLVVSADGLDGEGRETLAQEGYVVWAAGSRGEGYSSGAALVRDLDPQQVNLVELSCGPGGAAFARGMLRAMDESGCRAYQFTAASLGPAP